MSGIEVDQKPNCPDGVYVLKDAEATPVTAFRHTARKTLPRWLVVRKDWHFADLYSWPSPLYDCIIVVGETGYQKANIGDWIIMDGEKPLYVCKHEHFIANYNRVLLAETLVNLLADSRYITELWYKHVAKGGKDV